MRVPSRDLDHLLVRPWADPIIDQIGHDARSPYVERFWLGVIGPSATWFLRHIAEQFDGQPHGFDLDLALCAAALGLGSHKGPTATFPRMLVRCCQFRVARATSPASLEVRQMLPPLSQRQVAKLSPVLQQDHARWVDSTPAAAEIAALSDRARRLALSLLELGEDPSGAEHQLHRWRFHPAMAREAITWALDRHGQPTTELAAHRAASQPEPQQVGQPTTELAAHGAASPPDPQQVGQ